METSKRARKRELDIAKTDLEPLLAVLRHLKRDESHVTERSAAEWVGEGGRRRQEGRGGQPDE